jgi:hypothetical protein
MLYTPGVSCELLFENSPLSYIDKGKVTLDGKTWYIVAELDPESLKVVLHFYEHDQNLLL